MNDPRLGRYVITIGGNFAGKVTSIYPSYDGMERFDLEGYSTDKGSYAKMSGVKPGQVIAFFEKEKHLFAREGA